MSILRGIGSGGEWSVALESDGAAFRPGDTVRGTATLTPGRDFEGRRVLIELDGVEEAAYEVTERRSNGDSRIDRRWHTTRVGGQAQELAGATRFVTGQPVGYPFELTVPHDAPPSFDSPVLRLRWSVRPSVDAGGIDPAGETPITVLPIPPAAEVGSEQTSAARVDGDADGTRFAIGLDPAPLRIGQPFRGWVAISEALDPERTRVELKLRVSTTYSGGLGVGVQVGAVRFESEARRAVHDDRVLWQGRLAPAEAVEGFPTAYAFEGVVPAEPVPTVVLPNGYAEAWLDVIVDRRMRRDIHFRRPVAIAYP